MSTTLLSLPGRAVARALRTTQDKGPLASIYLMRFEGAPIMVSSDGHHMMITRLPALQISRTYRLLINGAMVEAKNMRQMDRPEDVLYLEESEGKLTWRLHTSKTTAVFAANYSVHLEVLEREFSVTPDFTYMIRAAAKEQTPVNKFLIAPSTMKLVHDMKLGAARIYGSENMLTPYCITFPTDPSVYLLAMASEWRDEGVRIEPLPYWGLS